VDLGAVPELGTHASRWTTFRFVVNVAGNCTSELRNLIVWNIMMPFNMAKVEIAFLCLQHG